MGMRFALMLAAVLLGPVFVNPSRAYAQDGSSISIRDPEAHVLQLKDMGYRVGELTGRDDLPVVELELADIPLAIVYGGCSGGLDCRYIVIFGSFTDVEKPPMAWVAERNANFDLIKVWVNDAGHLAFGAGAPVEGWPRSSFKSWIDQIILSAQRLGREAIESNLVATPARPQAVP